MLSNQLQVVLALVLGYLLYTYVQEKRSISQFVPYNSFEAPTTLKPEEWQHLNDKFGTLVQLVNTTAFSVTYQLNNMTAALSTILNNMGLGRFDVLSVGDSTPLTLTNVVVQDANTLAVMRFKRVDFIVDSMNPFIIHRMVLTPDEQYISSQKVLPQDKLSPSMFRIDNQLHLFSPYKTSDDDMRLTTVDQDLFNKTMADKALQLNNMATQDAVPVGTVATLPAMSLPTATQVSSEIVGAGPLHPIGL